MKRQAITLSNDALVEDVADVERVYLLVTTSTVYSAGSLQDTGPGIMEHLQKPCAANYWPHSSRNSLTGREHASQPSALL